MIHLINAIRQRYFVLAGQLLKLVLLAVISTCYAPLRAIADEPSVKWTPVGCQFESNQSHPRWTLRPKRGGVLLLTANHDANGIANRTTDDLFNGKDLTGWHADIPDKDNDPDVKPSFIVRDGLLVSLGTPPGHLITDASHQDYRLVVQYRFAGKPGNCGVLVHASTPRSLYKMFPKSIEVQMNHEHAGDFWCIVEDITVPDMVKRRGPKDNWGITEGKGRRILNLTDGSEKPVGQWNDMVIECFRDEVKVWVNGDLVNHGTDCTAAKGQIAVQAEGSEVEFRKLAITPIQELSADDKF